MIWREMFMHKQAAFQREIGVKFYFALILDFSFLRNNFGWVMCYVKYGKNFEKLPSQPHF